MVLESRRAGKGSGLQDWSDDSWSDNAVIKVIGVGGGGNNAVQHMCDKAIEGVDFICANTDLKALRNLRVKGKLRLGEQLTKGLGAGANPDIGRQAAIESRDEVISFTKDADIVFITAGMGGGTGTGAAPVVAEIARESGVLTVAVVTRPFEFEGSKRRRVADQGIKALAEHVDSLIIIPNDKLLPTLGQDISLIEAFAAANDVLLGAVQGISDLITRPGLIGVDFADVRTVMREMGISMMGTGYSANEANSAIEATNQAIESPLLENIDLRGAKGVLVNITAGENLSLGQFNQVGNLVKDFAAEDATVVIGTAIDPEMQEGIRVTVVATGLNEGFSTAYTSDFMQMRNQRIIKEQHGSNKFSHDRKSNKKPGHQSDANTTTAANRIKESDKDLNYLDVPAFIRKQSD